MKKVHSDVIEETLNELETYLVRVTPRHRHQLRLLLRRLVRQCLKEKKNNANDERSHAF